MKHKIFYLLALSAMIFISCKKEQVESPVAPNTSLDTNPPAIQQPTNEEVDAAKPTEITFDKTKHDFGKINQGDKVTHVFTFKNTGENDLKIARAQGSCGCTVPEFPKDPIAPGKTGTMKVSFNSTGKSGPQHKTVTVFANVPNGSVVLDIEANIQTK